MKTVGLTGAVRFALAGVSIGFAGLAAAQTTSRPAAEAPVSIDGNAPLRDELLAILKDDQEGRSQIDAVGKAHGFNSPEMHALWASMAAKDAANLVKVRAILDAHGWVGPAEVGPQANSAVFLVIQHSDLGTQQKYLPMLRAAVQEKKALPGQLALMEDRVALAEGRRQIYGSQLYGDRANTGRKYVAPMEDPDHVDERRAAMGLAPMAENLKRFGVTWDLAAYKRDLPRLEIDEWGGPPRPGGYDAALLAEIVRLADASTSATQRLIAAQSQLPADSKELRELEETAQRQQAADAAHITAILDQRGWVGRAQVGRRGTNGIMALLLGADIATLQRYLPMVRTAMAERQTDEAYYAIMEDRVALAEGRRQIYGTQFWWDPKTNASYVAPLEKPEQVDERRATLGLGSMAENVKPRALTWDVAAYQQQLPTIEALGPLNGFGQRK